MHPFNILKVNLVVDQCLIYRAVDLVHIIHSCSVLIQAMGRASACVSEGTEKKKIKRVAAARRESQDCISDICSGLIKWPVFILREAMQISHFFPPGDFFTFTAPYFSVRIFFLLNYSDECLCVCEQAY